MSPSSPVSIGIPLGSSNRTLEVGSAHVWVPKVLLLTFAQFPVAEEPFTEVSVGKVYSTGNTVKHNSIIQVCFLDWCGQKTTNYDL